MDLPAQFTKPDVGYLLTGDTVPSNIDPSTISYFGKFLSALSHPPDLTRAL